MNATYEKPVVRTFTADEIVELMGPAQGRGSGAADDSISLLRDTPLDYRPGRVR